MKPEPLKDKMEIINNTIPVSMITDENIKNLPDGRFYKADVSGAIEFLKNKLIEEGWVELPELEKFTKPTHGTCCTCQTCGGDIDHCYCGNHLEIFDLIDKAFRRNKEKEIEQK